ncbi:MAG TPA: hypothetical protein VMW81_07995 [Nitrospinota bacterium]|nr:hypothetical protein [Nitrospinota bacterium]
MTKIKLILFLFIFFIAGCSAHQINSQSKDIKSADSYTRHQIKKGLMVGIDPIIEPHRIKAVFNNQDMVSKKILPIYVVISNKGNRSHFLDTLQIFLVNNKGEKQFPISDSDLIERLTGFRESEEKRLPFGLDFIRARAFSNKYRKASRLKKNLIEESLKSMTISPRHQTHGYLFFSMDKDERMMGKLFFPLLDVVDKRMTEFEIVL